VLALDVEGDLASLPPAVDLAGFRIVQEALNNVQKHAGPGAGASIVVRVLPSELVVEVENGPGAGAPEVAPVPVAAGAAGGTPPAPAPVPVVPAAAPAGGGYGLVGMRERAGYLGGSLDAGPDAGGGWAVRARLPLAPPVR